MDGKLDRKTLMARVDNIERIANNYWPDGMYRDMAMDEILRDSTRKDEDIAYDLAQRWAFP